MPYREGPASWLVSHWILKSVTYRTGSPQDELMVAISTGSSQAVSQSYPLLIVTYLLDGEVKSITYRTGSPQDGLMAANSAQGVPR